MPRRSRSLFPPAPAARLRYCFPTTADGRIAVRPDWPDLLLRLTELPALCVQVAHPHGRFSVRLEAGQRHGQGLDLSGVEGVFERWQTGWARLEQCACCGAPGRLSVYHRNGLELIRFCPPAPLAPEDWAAVLATVATQPSMIDDPADTAAGDSSLPVFPAHGRTLPLPQTVFHQFLIALADSATPITLRLANGGGILTHRFVPEGVFADGQQLFLRGPGAGFLLHLGALRGFGTYLETDQREQLCLLGGDEAVLATLGPAPGELPQSKWEAALQETLS